MGLHECADTLIGNWHSKGITGGEKKRLSIALEILTRPHLLFLDEPTTGLDSAAAFFVVQALKNIAQDGRTVVSAIHQPSSQVFALFDDLFLLSGDETVHFGEAKMAAQFFAEAGFPCPQRRNSSDHFLRCINSDFDVVTETLRGSNGISENPQTLDLSTSLPTTHIKSILIKKFIQSEYTENAKARLQEISSIEGLVTEKKRGTEASWWKQLLILARRSSVLPMRGYGKPRGGAYKNDMIGLEFDPLVPGMPKLKGDVILTTMLGISLDHSKWWDLFAVMVILIVYRFLFFAILKIKEKALPFVQTLYTKRAVQLLSKKASFRQASFRKIPSALSHPWDTKFYIHCLLKRVYI
ncbi:hypothetical protein ACFE04_028835 [Oxalis oulophora]